MNRTDRLKVDFGVVLGLLFFVFLGLLFYFGVKVGILISIVLTLGIPGRVTGLVWKDLFGAKRMMIEQRHKEAIPYIVVFLDKLEAKPSIGKLIWVSPSFYTVSVRAMALNNLGACRLEMGDLAEAEKHFGSALEVDPLYPLPHFNLAVVAGARNEAIASQEHLAEAEELGYTGDLFDQILDRIKSAYAKFEPMAQ